MVDGKVVDFFDKVPVQAGEERVIDFDLAKEKAQAAQKAGITPDVVIVGKALSGGFYPVSAVLASKEVLGVFNPGDHGSTFGGNPLACAVARSALRVLVEENLIQRSTELGDYFLTKLKTLKSPHIREVRGKGLWIGIELDVPARPYCDCLLYTSRCV